MGRPIRKNLIGNPASVEEPRIIIQSAWIPGEVGPIENVYVEKQVGTGRYKVSDGEVSGVVRLVNNSELSEGEAHLIVTGYDKQENEYVRVIHNRTLNTWEGNTYKWSFEEATEYNECSFYVEPEPVDEPE